MIIVKEYGSRFKIWCKLGGRLTPTATLVTALDSDLDTGIALVKQHSNPKHYRNLMTFMTGRGRLK